MISRVLKQIAFLFVIHDLEVNGNSQGPSYSPRANPLIAPSRLPKASSYISSNDKKIIPMIERNTLNQKLDHFNQTNSQTWRQNYLYKKSYGQTENGPIFLVISGESPADRNWLTNQGVPFVQLADRLNASIYLLEHRFYGDSHPTNDTSSSNLQYLNARQAVEDIDEFVREINRLENFQKPKWVTFGGSYSGSLAAWSRAKHPRRIRAAVASSAPLQAKLNFNEFESEVEKIISRFDRSCANSLHNAFLKMKKMMESSDGRGNLVKIFSNCIRARTKFFSNKKSHRDELTLASICTKLKQNVSLVHGVRDVIATIMIAYGRGRYVGLDVGYQSFIEFMRNNQWDAPNAQPRAWLYQNCYEFGHFRTSESDNGLFAGTLPLSFFLERCADVFDIKYDRSDHERKIAKTNQYFGGNHNLKASNLILPYGSEDPWTILGVSDLKFVNGNDLIMIEGASHVADLYPSRKSDLLTLKIAQNRIWNRIIELIA